MTTSQPVLEAPALGPMQPPAETDAGRQAEPDLAADQIQANIFPGFNKDAQTLLFLRITGAAAFAVWLRDFIPTTSLWEVAAGLTLFASEIPYSHSMCVGPTLTRLPKFGRAVTFRASGLADALEAKAQHRGNEGWILRGAGGNQGGTGAICWRHTWAAKRILIKILLRVSRSGALYAAEKHGNSNSSRGRFTAAMQIARQATAPLPVKHGNCYSSAC